MGSVADLYETRVAKGLIGADPAQRAVLPQLDGVMDGLAAAPRKRPAAWRRWLGSGDAPPAAPPVRGLYLWGGVGRGKSMLMDLLAEAAGTRAGTGAGDAPVAVRRVHFHRFMQDVQAGLTRARQRGDPDAVRPVAAEIAATVRLLCLDEMQITDIADAMIVGRLFQVLLEAGVAIVATSNRAPEDLYRHGLNRALFLPFIALIRDRLEVVCLDSPTDHRQGRRPGAPVWFCPADARAAAAMDAAWAAHTNGAPWRPLRIEVGGRAFVLPRFADGVGRADFWDLCGQPLGPADYLALAGAVRVLMIDAIPRLSAGNYNEAKRFVTLIDTLYEARVRLLASAADRPEQLYNEGEGSFEFERTASRLREMQDAAWGQAA